jgi:hypothetical protein
MLSKMDGTVSIGKPMKNITLVAALATFLAFSAKLCRMTQTAQTYRSQGFLALRSSVRIVDIGNNAQGS